MTDNGTHDTGREGAEQWALSLGSRGEQEPCPVLGGSCDTSNDIETT